MDLCSGGMIWSCCVNKLQHTATQEADQPQTGALHNASEYFLITFNVVLGSSPAL